MFHVFVCEAFAARALGQSDPFAQRTVIGFAVGRVQVADRGAAGDAYWHDRLEKGSLSLVVRSWRQSLVTIGYKSWEETG